MLRCPFRCRKAPKIKFLFYKRIKDEILSKVICSKPNNVWDLEGRNRNIWLRVAKRLVNALDTVGTLISKARKSKNVLNKLMKSTSEVSNIIMATVPRYIRNILQFLDRYKNPYEWESSTIKSLADFENFIKDVQLAEKDLKM